MESKKGNTAKKRALLQNGTLNKSADKVVDPKFKNIAFFDPDDIVQVKYEMLRSNQKGGVVILKASKAYGFSRISFYKIGKAFNKYGLSGLLPKKRGPRRAHKLSEEVMKFVSELTDQKPDIRSTEIKKEIEERFSITVHKRSIERAIKRSKKNTEKPGDIGSFPDNLLKDYEDLRSYVLDSICGSSHPLGLDLFLKKGFLKWIQIQAECKVYRRPVQEADIEIKEKGFLPKDLQNDITLLLANMILKGSDNNVSAQWG